MPYTVLHFTVYCSVHLAPLSCKLNIALHISWRNAKLQIFLVKQKNCKSENTLYLTETSVDKVDCLTES